MQVYQRLVACNEFEARRIFYKDELACSPFQKHPHADVHREHVAHDAPNSRRIETALSLQNLDCFDLDALSSHVLRGHKMKQGYAALLLGVETEVFSQSSFKQRQKGRFDPRVIIL